jgi:hypothetical protein
MEYIAGTTVSETVSHAHHETHVVVSMDHELDDHNHHTALPNLFFKSSIDSHHHINLLNRDIGHSHVKN